MSAPPLDRLRDSRDIAAVLRAPDQRAAHLVALHVRRMDDDEPARLAVVASRRVGGAVQRNRAKRLLREAAQRIDWPRGVEIVLVARAACVDSDLESVRRELTSLVGVVLTDVGT